MGENLKDYYIPEAVLKPDIPDFQEPSGSPEPDLPPLPEAAHIDPTIGKDACKWLDDYIDFSKKWSPRAFEGFHEACGLWLLSTVAARRVSVNLGKKRYTNLYIALTARTSLYAKSTTADIAIQTIQKAGMAYLLTADSATPQKFVSDLTIKLANDYDELDNEQQTFARLRAGMAGQRGWYYDEFGWHIAAMMRDGGFMADFRGLLRRLDDTADRYEYGSIGRGSEVVERPYLALLGNLTPDDLIPFAKRGASLWGDGFLARFATITPPEGERKRERFPSGERIIPSELIMDLVHWHQSLELPDVQIESITDKDGKATGSKRVEVFPPPGQTLDLASDIYEAFYSYHDGLLDLVNQSQNPDFDGNYARFAEKAIRVAALLASVSGCTAIEMKHWARAQTITERWRAGLHELYRQVNEPAPSDEKEKEERVLKIIYKLEGATAADVARYIRNMSTTQAANVLDGLANAGELDIQKTKKGTKKYVLRTNS